MKTMCPPGYHHTITTHMCISICQTIMNIHIYIYIIHNVILTVSCSYSLMSCTIVRL